MPPRGPPPTIVPPRCWRRAPRPVERVAYAPERDSHRVPLSSSPLGLGRDSTYAGFGIRRDDLGRRSGDRSQSPGRSPPASRPPNDSAIGGVAPASGRIPVPRSGTIARTRPRRRPRLGHIRKQRHLPRTLDGDCDLPLMPSTRSGHPGRTDLAPLGDVAPQLVDVLVVDLAHLVLAEEARLPPHRLPGATGTTGARSGLVFPRSRAACHQSTLPCVTAAGRRCGRDPGRRRTPRP